MNAILVLKSPDHKGIALAVDQFVFDLGGNIVNSDQHLDQTTEHFFMRVEWETRAVSGERQAIQHAFETSLLKKVPGLQGKLFFSDVSPSVAVMLGPEDHCLQELMYGTKNGELDGDIRLIMSNHTHSGLGEYYHYWHITPDTKLMIEKAQLALMEKERTQLLILAKYMQIMSPDFLKRCEELDISVINIHHSLQPAFIGARPYHQAFERGVKIIGATAHYVTEELDAGPIIVQSNVSVNHRDDVNEFIRKGKKIERSVLLEAVRLHLQRRVMVHANRTIVFD